MYGPKRGPREMMTPIEWSSPYVGQKTILNVCSQSPKVKDGLINQVWIICGPRVGIQITVLPAQVGGTNGTLLPGKKTTSSRKINEATVAWRGNGILYLYILKHVGLSLMDYQHLCSGILTISVKL